MVIRSADVLARSIHELGLIDPGQHAQLARLSQQSADAAELARRLRHLGWLTAFQAYQLLEGNGAGLVLGPYVLIDRIAAGGMGVVFQARHRRLRRIDALKVIRSGALDDPVTVQRFLREAEVAASLSHPNIVHVHNAGQEGDTHYLTMEFIDGIDLGRLLLQAGPLPVAIACDFVRQAALGLHHAHERGVIHRDVKPANLLVAPPAPSGGAQAAPPDAIDRYAGGTVKVLDMGLARLLSVDSRPDDPSLTQQGVVIGTMDYLAPEQAKNPRTADRRADLYSLGCTLYHLLTGQPPFLGGMPLDKLLRHQSEEARPVADLRPETPLEVALLVRRLMAKSPDQRFQTGAELADSLAALAPELARRAGTGHSETVQPADTRRTGLQAFALPPTRILRAEPAPVRPPDGPPDDTSRGLWLHEPSAGPKARWRNVALLTGGLSLLLLSLAAGFWLPSSPPPPDDPPAPAGDALAEYLPADSLGVLTFRPADLLSSPLSMRSFPGLERLFRTAMPTWAGRQGMGEIDKVRIVWTTPDATHPLVLLRSSRHPGLGEPTGFGLAAVGEGLYQRMGEKGANAWLGTAPPYLLLGANREQVQAGLDHARGPSPLRPRDARLGKVQEAGPDQAVWLDLALDRLHGRERLPSELKTWLRPILELTLSVEGGVRVSRQRVEASLHFRARSREQGDLLERALKAVCEEAKNTDGWNNDFTRTWKPVIALVKQARLVRSGPTEVRLETRVPPARGPRPGNGVGGRVVIPGG